MGGRGGSFGSGKGASGIIAFKTAGVRIESDVKELNPILVNKALDGVRDTLAEFGLPLTAVNEVGVTDAKNARASTNGFGDLLLAKGVFSSGKNELDNNNYTADSTAYGTGTHEAGHIILNRTLNKSNENLSMLEKAKMRTSGKWARQILKNAKKANGGVLSPISEYGSSSKGKAASEMVAEAVSEYMAKGKSASATSRAIVKALKSYL